MTISNEFSLPDGTRALKIILEGTGSKGPLISRIEVLEAHRESQGKAYDEYREATRKSIEKIDSELDDRMKTLQVDVYKELAILREQDFETKDAHHREIKGYMISIMALLVLGFGTVLWKWIAK
jgi:hypothetical protein